MSDMRYERAISCSVDGEKIDIRIIEFAHSYAVEVTSTPVRGDKLTVHMTANSIEKIREALSAERLYCHFKMQLESVLESLRTHTLIREDRRQLESISDMVAKIPQCEGDFTLTALLKEILERLGITSFLFITYLADSADKDRSSYNFQQGCDGLFFSQYRDRAWHDMDPFIAYARLQQKPVFISGFPKISQGEKDFHAHCEKHGFASGMVVPARSDTGNRIGMLLVGINTAAASGEEVLGRHKTLIRGIALDVLEWWIEHLKPRNIDVSKLEQIDRDILKLVHKSKSDYKGAREIALMLNINEDKVYNRYRKINATFGTNKIRESVQMALEYGVIGSY